MVTAANKIIRSKKNDAEKIDLLKGLNISEKAACELLIPDWCGRKGFADYQLKNNGANIRRMRDRLAELEKKAVATMKVTARADGIRVVENTDDDRLQIFFPGKPDAGTIKKLKAKAFHWSPRNGCWQRQLTENAKRVLNGVLPN